MSYWFRTILLALALLLALVLAPSSCASSPACEATQEPYPALLKPGAEWTPQQRRREMEDCLQKEADAMADTEPFPDDFCEMRLELRRRALGCMVDRGWRTGR